MTNGASINRPDVVAPIEETARAGSLFGAHPGSVRIGEGVDLTGPVLDVEPEAGTGEEIER